MSKYQLQVPHEFEAFHLGIELSIIQAKPSAKFRKEETKDATIYFITFQSEDQMYAYDKEIREKAPYLFS